MEDNKLYMLEDDQLVEVSGGDVEPNQHIEARFRCAKNGIEECRKMKIGFVEKFAGDCDAKAEKSARHWCECFKYEFIEYLGCSVVRGRV